MKQWIRVIAIWLGVMVIWGANTALAIDADMTDVAVSKPQDHIMLSAGLELPFKGKIEETIHSGIDTTFVFKVELLKERFLWFDEEIISHKITHTVKYDTLTKQYTLHNNNANNEQSLVTTDFEDMKKWMTTLERVRVISLKNIMADDDYATGSYYIRVMSEMEALEMPFPLEYILFFVSFQEFETSWVYTPLTDILAR